MQSQKISAVWAGMLLAVLVATRTDASCPVSTISGNVTASDGSTPVSGAHINLSVVPAAGGTGFVVWDAPLEQAIQLQGAPGIGTWTVKAGITGGYFADPNAGSITCWNDGECQLCTGSITGFVFANQGAVHGSVSVHPESRQSVDLSSLSVYVRDAGALSHITSAPIILNAYTFRIPGANDWGLGVFCGGTSGGTNASECESVGTRGVEVYINQASKASVTLVSSEDKPADLEYWLPGYEPPDTQSCQDPGKPVNIFSGNVYLRQADGSVSGFSPLTLTRTYNSQVARRGVMGAFGLGWTHSLEASVTELQPGQLMLRQPSGVVMYFVDLEADGTYRASVPRDERSRFVKQANGSWVRELLGGGTEAYDASGRVSAWTDVSGNTTTFTRDATGRLLSVAEPGGRKLDFSYNAQGRVEMVSGPLGPLAAYTYDNTLLHDVRYPDGGGYVFLYDSLGQVLRVDDLSGRVVEAHTYDVQGRGLTSELRGGREKYTLSYGDWQTTVTDGLGNVTTYDWNLIRGMRRVTRSSGCAFCGSGDEAREWTYDAMGREQTVTYSDGSTVTYEYDAEGNRLSETRPEGTTTFTYDSGGRVLTRIGPGGVETSFTYDTLGRLTSTTERVTATQTRTTAIGYDMLGRTSSITDARGKVTTMAYHPTGELATVTDPLGHTTSFAYDATGRRTVVTDPLGHTNTTAYDAMDRVSTLTGPDGALTAFTYDPAGNRTSVVDPLGRRTSYVYNDYGWLAQVIDAIGGVTHYEYDIMGRLTALVDAKAQRTTFAYDPHGRMTSTTYPGGAQESYTYDAGGRLATRTDRKGVVTTYSYDAAGRLLGKTYSDGTTPPVSYTYDAAGRLATAANGTDTLTWTYDLAGQLLSEVGTKNASTVAYTYDLGGNRVSLSLDGQVFVTYAYDDASRLTSITRGTQVFGFGYDAVGRRTSLTYPNGVATSYAYDVASRVLDIHAQKGAQTIARSQYTYDASGNRLTKTHPEYTETYGYDNLYRLTGVDRVGSTPPSRWSYGYDGVGNRLWEQRDDTVTSYAYDERNRLLSTAVGGRMQWRGTLSEAGNVNFTSAQVNGQPARMRPGNVFEAEIPVVVGTNTVTLEARDLAGNATVKQYQVGVTGDVASYTYDANGNLTSKTADGHAWAYEWNAENLLQRVTKDSTEIARYAYDPLGRRVEKVTGTAVHYVLDSGNILRQTNGSATSLWILPRTLDEPLARQEPPGAITYYHLDGLDSVILATDQVGQVIERVRYDSWGNVEAGAVPAYGYTGRELEFETSLVYMRARYYSPREARSLGKIRYGREHRSTRMCATIL